MSVSCCSNPTLRSALTIEGEELRERILCASCNHLHLDEVVPVPVRWPGEGYCYHCGGMLEEETFVEGRPTNLRCEGCSLTEQEALEMHRRLAHANHGSQGLILGAVRALEGQRLVLSIKLATAAAMSGEDPGYARLVRLQAMAAGGLGDMAMDEAWNWLTLSGPAVPVDTLIWLAGMEAESGNLPGTRRALEAALRLDPRNVELWTDFAEVLVVTEDWHEAVQAARMGVGDADDEIRARNLQVITDVAEAMYARELYAESLSVVAQAGEHVESHVELAWLRARIAALKNDLDVAREWLQIVLTLEPDHVEARQAWDKVKPEERRGWFGFGRGSK